MIEWILSSSILILAMLLLRHIFKNKIAKRLQYALWVFVALRLLLPGTIFQSAASVENLFSQATQAPIIRAASGELSEEASYNFAVQEVLTGHKYPADVYSALPPVRQEAILTQYQPEIQNKLTSYETARLAARLLHILWFTGCVVMGLCLLGTNLGFYRKLRNTRKQESVFGQLPVYLSSCIQAPCLFGLFSPAIYLPEADYSPDALTHILAHEKTHYRHKDHIWAVVRCICLALHWYNPLVWVAAKISRDDSELACDEGTLAGASEEVRNSYGRTLIEISCAKPSVRHFLLTDTTMTDDKKNLYRRVQAIAKKPKTLLVAAIVLVAVLLTAALCTFTGSMQESTPVENISLSADAAVPVTTAPPTTLPNEVSPPDTAVPSTPPSSTAPATPAYHEDVMAIPMVRAMGMLYVLDKDADSFSQTLPENYVYLGLCYEDNENIPKWNKSARHIPQNSELYASVDHADYIYYRTGSGYQRLIRAALVENDISKDDPDNTAPEVFSLAFFDTLIGADLHSPYNQSTDQIFTRPEDVNLKLLFYNGFIQWDSVPLTQEEIAFLTTHGWSVEKPVGNAERFPVSAMDEQLQRFLGITFEQSHKVGLDRMGNYWEQTQCYYNWRSDARGYRISVLRVTHNADRTRYEILYECDNGYPNTFYCMTLIRSEGVFLIYSNTSAVPE